MLIKGSQLLGIKVLSLQLGGPVAKVTELVVNPANLQIIAFKVAGPLIGGETGDILDAHSIREFSQLGFIIDDTDELVNQTDVVKIDKVMRLNFDLVGLKVVTKKGSKLGKVADFTLDPASLVVQQLIVQRPTLRALLDPELTIARAQIVEIDDYKVTVKDATAKARATKTSVAEDFVPNFVNPFRKPEPAEVAEHETEV